MKIKASGGGATAEDDLKASLLACAEPIFTEIERSVDYFRSLSGGENIKQILLSGGGAKIPGLADDLSQRLNIPTEIMNPLRKIDFNRKVLDESHLENIGSIAAVGVGLALRRVGDK
jgi:type IV pilus assembly protein PilM